MNPRPAWRCRAANGLMGTYMPSTSASPFVGPDVKGNAGRVLPVSAANGSMENAEHCSPKWVSSARAVCSVRREPRQNRGQGARPPGP